MARKAQAFVGTLLLLAVGAVIAYRTGLLDLSRGPVIVAIVDTGVDGRIPAIAAHLAVNDGEKAANQSDDDRNGFIDDVGGWNLLEANGDTSDLDGHGTKMALAVIQNCGECRILPIRVTKGGAAITPTDIAAAIRFAESREARVISFSFGVTQGSPDLEAAVNHATAQGVVMISAAGTGVPNPFRPAELSNIYPQAYPPVIVVGAAKALDEPDVLMNFGDLLDLVVTGQSEETFGSSHAAAAVSGHVAAVLARHPRYDGVTVRELLRDSATQPKLLMSQNAAKAAAEGGPLTRLGFGGFDAAKFGEASPRAVSHKLYNNNGGLLIDVSAPGELDTVTAQWSCPGATPPADSLKTVALKKGRARVTFEGDASKACKVRINVKGPGVAARALDVDLN